MTIRKRWSRAAIALTFAVMTILGATACYAWIQQEQATDRLRRRAYALAQNSLQDAPAAANYIQTPSTSGSVSFARVVRHSLPKEQLALVSLVRSTSKEIDSGKKTEARNQLMRLVEQELDGRFSSQAAELSLLEKRVAEAKEKLAQRAARRNEIVERRMAEILSEPDDLAWNADIIVQNANDQMPRTLPPLPVQPNNSLQTNNFAPQFPTIQSAPFITPPAGGPVASPGNGAPLNFSVPMGIAPPASIPPASAPEPMAPLDEPAPAAKTPNDIATLLKEVIDLETEFEELDSMPPQGKIEAVQRLMLRKRLRRLELGLETETKKAESDQRLKSLSLDLAEKELDFSQQEFSNAKELYNKGATSTSEMKTIEFRLERDKNKVVSLEQELNDRKTELKMATERIQNLRKKMDDILQVQKPAPEVLY